MLTRTQHTPAAISRRTHAQRRLRRTAVNRLFCTTNGCTTFLLPDEEGLRAVCPVCGLERELRARHQERNAPLPH